MATAKKKGPALAAVKKTSSKAKTRSTKAGEKKSRTISPSGKAAVEKPREVKPSGKYDANFFEQVYAVARMIPRGRVTSYGAIAQSLGTKLSSRMVGWAMNSCRSARPKVPAHRVVNRLGILSGKHHFEDPSEMERLLAKEGVQVKSDQVVDFKNLFWDPSKELGL